MKKSAKSAQLSREAALLDFVERLSKFRPGRRAIHVRLSQLRAYNRRSHHLRIAATTFDRLARVHEGALFKMFNDDMVLLTSGASVARIDESVLHLRYLFSEDPLLKSDEDGREPFCMWFDLEQDYDELLALAREMVEARARHDATPPPDDEPADEPAPSMPMDPTKLTIIESAIAHADISTMLRRQPICAVTPGARPQPVYDEIFTSIESLRQTLMPDTDLMANRWLFQDLTEHLDRRVIAHLARNDDASLKHAFSINLNISTLLSPEFLAFDDALNSGTRRSIVIELQLIDVYADIGNYIFARDYLRERGYRFCLDAMTHISLPLVDRTTLGFDLIKLVWSADLYDQLSGERGDALRHAIEEIRPDRVILTRCDSEQALDVGHSLGIRLYQGFLLDEMISRGVTREESIVALSEALARHRIARRA